MDRELIERLAKQADVGAITQDGFVDQIQLVAFAALVAQECIDLCGTKGRGWPLDGPATIGLCQRAIREAFKAPP